MFRCVFFLLFALFFAPFVHAETNEEGSCLGKHSQTTDSINDIAPLAVGCTEEEAVLTNSIDCDRDRFMPNCVKISLSKNPVITWKSFDLVRHNVVILKKGVHFDERAVGFDIDNKQRENLPAEWSYNFETGEFMGRPNGELRNIDKPIVSLVNTGVGEYDIWCRYHFLVGMVMKLFVVE